MATTFTGALSVATAGREDIRTMMFAALGCNVAWGLADAVIYLIGTVVERRRGVRLLERLHATQDAATAHGLIAGVLPERIAAGATPAMLEAIRQGLLSGNVPSPRLGRRDLAGALGVFLLVTLSAFPVVIPFLFVGEAAPALRISNLLAVVTMFCCGLVLGRYAGGKPWQYGLVLSAVLVVLVGAIMALGG
jgi:VIT1/CCC1 family predicted Fe2+/Mn2+ transporter